jgi:hypothetical protein
MSHLSQRLRIRPSAGTTAWLISYTNREGSRSNLIFTPDLEGDIRKCDMAQLKAFVLAGEVTQNSWSVTREVEVIHQKARKRQLDNIEVCSTQPVKHATG